jgi:hypothetical protein
MSPSARHGPSFPRGIAIPLLTSAALHTLAAAVFFALAAGREGEPSRVVDTAVGGNDHPITLSLVSFPAAHPEQSAGPSSGHKAGEEEEFHATVLPAPTVEEGPPVAPPQIIPPAQPSVIGSGQPSRAGGSGVDSPGGTATGSGTSGFLNVPGPVRSVVYVIDCSMSMGGPDERSHKFTLARRELLASLRLLPEGTCFQVIPYNHQAESLLLDGQTGLVPKSERSVQAAADALEKRKPAGWTDHARALRRGLVLRPDVLFFVTDGDDLQHAQERDATALNKGQTVIHVVELGARPSPPGCALRALAMNNRGTYRHVSTGR